MITPRVFVSGVSSDLCSARQVVNAALTRIECLPVEESIFGTEYGPIREMLARKIKSCQAVVHVVGRDYGGEPDPQLLPAGQPRRSWTQIEYDLARQQNKKLYILFCEDAFPFDPITKPEPIEKSDLQNAHRAAVLTDTHLWHSVKSADELREQIENLKVPLDEVRDELRRQQVRHRLVTGLAALAIVLVALIVLVAVSSIGLQQQDESERAEAERTAQQQEREKQDEERKAAEEARQQAQKIVQVEQEFADRFLLQLITNKEISAEDARQRALQELPALVKLPLEEIRAMIDRKIPAASPEAPVSPLDRARTALAQGKLDDVFQAADEQRQEGGELAMLEGTAALAKFRESPKPQWNDRALAAFRRALAMSDRAKEPKAWTDAAISAALVLQDLAKYSEAEPLLIDARQILEKEHGAESREVAVVLSYLAWLLQATNRLAEAEPLMRRALAIDEHSYGAEHPDFAIRLNNLAQLL